MRRSSMAIRFFFVVLAGASLALLPTQVQPAASALRHTLKKDVCGFFHDIEGLDQLDVVHFLNKVFDEGEFDVGSFIFSGSDLAYTHFECPGPPTPRSAFDQQLSRSQFALSSLLQEHPKLSIDIFPTQPVVGLPVVSQPFVENGYGYIHLSWTISTGFSNVWIEVCSVSGCFTPVEYKDDEFGSIQSANVQVPVNEQLQIRVQPALASSASWTNTVPFVLQDQYGAVSLVIE
jgi:hypothetical protein